MIPFLILAFLIAAAVVGWLTLGRHGESPVPAGHWEPTEEVFRDPSSGRRMRVWVDPGDATRHYVPEPD